MRRRPSRINRTYGWRPQLPDHRDRVFRPGDAPFSPTTDLSLSPAMPAVYDQLSLGSCTANAISANVQYDLARQGLESFMPARLFVYFNERDIEGTTGQDAGAEIRDGIKTINSLGVCPESEWPYNVDQFAIKPSDSCYVDALKAKSVQYEAVNQDLNTILACLTQNLPVVIGFTVYQSFEGDTVAATGIMPMPADAEGVLGGHAVLVVGVNASTEMFNGIPPQYFKVRNSWGSGWGAAGYFYMPFAYLLNPNLASDFWSIQVMA